MKTLLSLVAVLLFVLAVGASAQNRLSGTVAEVRDGRTLVVESGSGPMNVQLQYVEVPEPGQPLHETVREHLARLTTGRRVEFKPVRILEGVTVSYVLLDGVDLSLQVLRDGAAWHEPVMLSGQDLTQSAEYAENEAKARAEKLGLWSVAGLKTPSELRAERDQALKMAEAATRVYRPAVVGVNQFQTANRAAAGSYGSWGTGSTDGGMDGWRNLFAGAGKEVAGMQTYRDPQDRFRAVYTSAAFVELRSGNISKKVEFRIADITVNMPGGGTRNVVLVGFHSIGNGYYFSERKNSLTFVADKKAVAVGGMIGGFRGREAYGDHELFYFPLTKSNVKRIASARNVDVRVNGLSGKLSDDSIQLLREFYKAL